MELSKANSLFKAVRQLVANTRSRVFQQVNAELIAMNWHIGKLIVEDEQGGKTRAIYGAEVLKKLSHQLTIEFGKGFDERNLRNMRAFYRAFQDFDTVRPALSWTHYRLLSRLEKKPIG